MEWPSPELKYLQAGGPQGLQALLEERIYNYREAAAIAKEAGEAAKARRCDRGLKVSQAVGEVTVKEGPFTGVVNMLGHWLVLQQAPGSHLGY